MYGRGIIHVLILFTIVGYIKTQDCSSGISDLVFMVDDSSSVQLTNFKLVLAFIVNVIQSLTIGSGDVQVSFLSFSNSVRTQFYLNNHTETDLLIKKVKSIRFRGGGTDIKKGLESAYNIHFSVFNGARVGAQKLLVIITDGKSTGSAAVDIAKIMRANGIKIICLGITNGVNQTELENIAGDAGLVFHADNFGDKLGEVQVEMSKTTCEATNVQLPDPCDAMPCFNGGTCSSSNGADFSCDCPASYSGSVCNQDVDECSLDIGGCSQLCVNLDGGYECSCNMGYALNQDMKTCTDVNECLDNLHECEQICVNSVGSFSCDCGESQSLNDDGKTCSDVDGCSTDSGGCSQICINQAGGHICSCNMGFILGQDEKTCNDINECYIDFGGCSQICTDLDGGYECSCDMGFVLDQDEKTCNDVDECTENLDNCQHTCVNSAGSFHCSCGQGEFLSNDGKSCHYVNECSMDFGGCSQICIDIDGGHECSCNMGFVLDQDKKTCNDVDECTENLDNCQHTCVNSAGSFHCSCGEGQRLNNDGKSCDAQTLRCYECSNLQDVRCGVTFDFPNGSEDALGYLRTCEGEFVMCRKLEYNDYQQGANTGGVIVTRSCWRSPGVEGYLPADECSELNSGESCYCSQEACNGSVAKGLSMSASALVFLITYFCMDQLI